MTSKSAPKTDSGLAARVAALASAGAALIHFAVAPDHWQEWAASGLFFVSLAAFQLIWSSILMIRPATPVLAAGIAVNLGSVALWSLSRTTGAPFGPHAGEPEVVQAAGLCALLLQTYVVMAAGWIWYRGRRSDLVSRFGYGVVLTGAGTVVAMSVTIGIASGLQHGHHSPIGTSEADHHVPSGVGAHHQPAPSGGPAPGVPSVPLVQTPHDEHHDHG